MNKKIDSIISLFQTFSAQKFFFLISGKIFTPENRPLGPAPPASVSNFIPPAPVSQFQRPEVTRQQPQSQFNQRPQTEVTSSVSSVRVQSQFSQGPEVTRPQPQSQFNQRPQAEVTRQQQPPQFTQSRPQPRPRPPASPPRPPQRPAPPRPLSGSSGEYFA